MFRKVTNKMANVAACIFGLFSMYIFVEAMLGHGHIYCDDITDWLVLAMMVVSAINVIMETTFGGYTVFRKMMHSEKRTARKIEKCKRYLEENGVEIK